MIPATAQQVTVTVGGNDGSAFETVGACLSATLAGSSTAATLCALALTPPDQSQVDAQVQGIAGLLMAIQQKAPGAQIYVTGYPLLFEPNGPVCTIEGVGSLPSGLLAAVDAATVALNNRILAAVAAVQPYGVNATYVDVVGVFADAGLCDGDSLIQGPADLAPLHPTVDGLAAYADAIADAEFITGPTR